MQFEISNSAFDDTEVQEIILSVEQVELNHLYRSQDIKLECDIHT